MRRGRKVLKQQEEHRKPTTPANKIYKQYLESKNKRILM